MSALMSASRLLAAGREPLLAAAAALLALALALAPMRAARRRERRYVRLRIVPYQGDAASAAALVRMLEALHKRLLRRWWRRLLAGQPSIALEAHLSGEAWLAVSCPRQERAMVLAALRIAYPNCRFGPPPCAVSSAPALLRLKKERLFTNRVKAIDRFEHEREPFMNRLLTAMAASGGSAFVQLAITPASVGFERHAKRLYRREERRISDERGSGLIEPRRDRSMVQGVELRGGLDVQHRPLYFADVRIVAKDRAACERIASALRAEVAENRLIERGTTLRHGVAGLYRRRLMRGEGNPLPCTRKGVYASAELAAMWQLPSPDFLAVPLRRSALPVAPAPATIMRAAAGAGTLIDARGAVSIHPAMRGAHTAVVGAGGQGKSSYLVASLVEDLLRPRCAVVLLDPKGDAAQAAASSVPKERACALLDLTDPALACALEDDSLRVDFDGLIGCAGVLIVQGALESMGAERTSALMRGLLAALEIALSREQRLAATKRSATVALKLDEAPLLLDRRLVETIALRRFAGLETVACWQSEAQWREREMRARLEATFAHRVYFATASVEDARRSAALTMAEFSDLVRPDVRRLSALGHPDARLRLPRHHAIASWVTPAGRELPFVGRTTPLRIDRERIAWHAARQTRLLLRGDRCERTRRACSSQPETTRRSR